MSKYFVYSLEHRGFVAAFDNEADAERYAARRGRYNEARWGFPKAVAMHERIARKSYPIAFQAFQTQAQRPAEPECRELPPKQPGKPRRGNRLLSWAAARSK